MNTKQGDRKTGVLSVIIVLLLVSVVGVIPVFAAAPSNDDIASATVVGSLPYSDANNTSEATVEGSEPTYACGNSVGATVWYSFTPFSTGEYFVNTSGSDFSDVLHVFEKTGMILVECGYGGNSTDSQVVFTATAGTTYLISAGGNYSLTGNLTLNIDQLGSFSTCAAVVDIPGAKCDALEALYTTTNGSSWTENTRWLTSDHICTWFGVKCHDGALVSLALNSNNLDGDLSTVDLTSLVNLNMVNLYYNSLTGDMSTVIGYLPTSIVYLRLYGNGFTGTIPAGIASFSALFDLNLSANQLSGDIAVVFSNLPVGISNLDLRYNNFFGTIPPAAASLTGLWTLDLTKNLLSGDLPSVIGNLPTSLGVIILSMNNFTGTIPSGISGFPNLYFLSLGDNQLDGDLGTIIGYLPTSLTHLSLRENIFSGTIPVGISGLSALRHLDLDSNQLIGDLSTIIGYLPMSMESLFLANNDFTGTIPAGISSLTNLVQFSIANNAGLSGTIPLDIIGLSLIYFNFQNTFLCEPGDVSYDTWKSGVATYYSGYCTPAASLLFEDDFETGDFSLWTRFNDGNGYLYPCMDAAINGTYGACVDRGTDKRKQLIDETPINQTKYNVRFNIDMNALSMTEGTRFRFVQVKMGSERPFFIVVKYQGGQYLIQLNTLLDDLTKVKTGWYLLSDAPHTLEVTWSAAAASGTDDGIAALFLDDVLLETRVGLDSDTIYVDTFKIGFTSRLDGKPISGIFYLDDIATANDGHIGLP